MLVSPVFVCKCVFCSLVHSIPVCDRHHLLMSVVKCWTALWHLAVWCFGVIHSLMLLTKRLGNDEEMWGDRNTNDCYIMTRWWRHPSGILVKDAEKQEVLLKECTCFVFLKRLNIKDCFFSSFFFAGLVCICCVFYNAQPGVLAHQSKLHSGDEWSQWSWCDLPRRGAHFDRRRYQQINTESHQCNGRGTHTKLTEV